MRRTWKVVFGSAAFCAAAALVPTPPAEAGASDAISLPRLVRTFRTILDEIVLKLPSETDYRRRHALNFTGQVMRDLPPGVENEVDSAGRVVRALGKTLLAETPFNVLVPQLLDDVHALAVREIDQFEEKVDRFEAANPEAKVARQRKAIAAARGLADASLLEPTGLKRTKRLGKALDKLRSVEKLDYVKKPPKSCGVKPLSKGEYARGPGTFADLSRQILVPAYFQANWGNVRKVGEPGTGTFDVDFGYCNGEGIDETLLEFIVPQQLGVHPALPNQAGFRRGRGFVSNVTSNSTITITAIDHEAGYVTGSYSFNASLGYGNGTVEFLLRIDE